MYKKTNYIYILIRKRIAGIIRDFRNFLKAQKCRILAGIILGFFLCFKYYNTNYKLSFFIVFTNDIKVKLYLKFLHKSPPLRLINPKIGAL